MELVLLWSILCRRIVLKVGVVNVMLNDNCNVLPFSFPFSVFVSAWYCTGTLHITVEVSYVYLPYVGQEKVRKYYFLSFLLTFYFNAF